MSATAITTDFPAVDNTDEKPVVVYVPRQFAEADLRAMQRIKQGSAIVAYEPSLEADRVQVYYEGNLYGAQNMITWTDRAMIAYGRMRDCYPTIATAVLDPSRFMDVGRLDPEEGRIELGNYDDGLPEEIVGLVYRWLGLDDPQLLSKELTVEGVRV